jgi:hypothetical protein
MEDIIAIRVAFADQPIRHVLTWGRIQDAVDPKPVEQLAAAFMSPRGIVSRTTVCDSLQEASQCPYFYEALFDMAQRRIPFGDGYEEWVRERDRAMREGREMWDCGAADPDVRNIPR